MKQKEAFHHVLAANMHRAICLAAVQLEIEQGNFDEAMGYQLKYLYWHDEFNRLYQEYKDKHLQLVLAIHGIQL